MTKLMIVVMNDGTDEIYNLHSVIAEDRDDFLVQMFDFFNDEPTFNVSDEEKIRATLDDVHFCYYFCPDDEDLEETEWKVEDQRDNETLHYLAKDFGTWEDLCIQLDWDQEGGPRKERKTMFGIIEVWTKDWDWVERGYPDKISAMKRLSALQTEKPRTDFRLATYEGEY